MDELAHTFVNNVNDIHRQGFKAEGFPTNLKGDQIDFFQEMGPKSDASTRIYLSDAVKDDLQNIVTSIYPNTPGNNEVALKISDLQFDKVMNSNSSSLEEYFLQNIGRIGMETSKNQIQMEQSEGILAQTTALKERKTGVSIDEEAANLVKYQYTYQAAAKVINAAEEMFRTVINIGR